MNESKIVSVQDLPASENEIIKRLKDLSSPIMKIIIPRDNNKITNSSVGRLYK